MTDFVQNHLETKIRKRRLGTIKILGYDQNRGGLKEWVDEMFKDEKSSKYFAGAAIHWYESTYDYLPDALQYGHQKAPNKYLIQTKLALDSEIPHWNDDAWYWKKKPPIGAGIGPYEKDKYLHPKYAPVNRYATDIIGCFNDVG